MGVILSFDWGILLPPLLLMLSYCLVLSFFEIYPLPEFKLLNMGSRRTLGALRVLSGCTYYHGGLSRDLVIVWGVK